MSSRKACWVWWMMALLCAACVAAQGTDDAGPTPVHVPDTPPETWTPATATPVQPPCSDTTQERLTKFSLLNIALQRRCQAQSGGVNAFPFDVAPSRDQLVRLSTSDACLFICKGILRLVEHECLFGDVRMPIRATTETVLKLHQDRKDLAKFPIPSDDVLQQQIVERARLNTARDINPIGFDINRYPVEMQQYETQLTKSYAGGIVMLSSDFKILNDLTETEQQAGSDAAATAVAELGDHNANDSAHVSSSTTGSQHYADSSAVKDQEIEHTSASPSHGSFRDETSHAGSTSGSLNGGTIIKPKESSVSARLTVTTTVISVAFGFQLVN